MHETPEPPAPQTPQPEWAGEHWAAQAGAGRSGKKGLAETLRSLPPLEESSPSWWPEPPPVPEPEGGFEPGPGGIVLTPWARAELARAKAIKPSPVTLALLGALLAASFVTGEMILLVLFLYLAAVGQIVARTRTHPGGSVRRGRVVAHEESGGYGERKGTSEVIEYQDVHAETRRVVDSMYVNRTPAPLGTERLVSVAKRGEASTPRVLRKRNVAGALLFYVAGAGALTAVIKEDPSILAAVLVASSVHLGRALTGRLGGKSRDRVLVVGSVLLGAALTALAALLHAAAGQL